MRPKPMNKEDYATKLWDYLKLLKDAKKLSDKEWTEAKQLVLDSKFTY